MTKQFLPKFALSLASLFFSVYLFAQTAYDGNTFIDFLGKAAASSEIKDLKTNYQCEMANETHYLSKQGVELIFQKGSLNEIHLYNNSPVYGGFKGKLPQNLRFGMTSGEVKSLLGKPTASYNSGYSEFEYSNYIISCWMEGGRLVQVAIAVK